MIYSGDIYQANPVGKWFTHMCSCHQVLRVHYWSEGSDSVILYGWEGNLGLVESDISRPLGL